MQHVRPSGQYPVVGVLIVGQPNLQRLRDFVQLKWLVLHCQAQNLVTEALRFSDLILGRRASLQPEAKQHHQRTYNGLSYSSHLRLEGQSD